MKLSKLYSNKDGFKDITFNLEGLNVVYAEVKSKVEEKKNSHDIGKTKLAELIDFLFLKKSDSQRNFLLKLKDDKEELIFIKYVFFLELKLNSGKFLTIRRSIENSTKISFSVNDQRNTDYTPPTNWNYENIPFNKAKVIFEEYLSLDFFSNKSYDFRKAISYSLRTQGDYEDVYKLSKFVGGKDLEWKPFMFDLLGFDGALLSKKYDNDNEREEIKGYINKLKNEYSVKIEDRDDIVAQIKLVESGAKEVEDQIDRFNFYEKDKDLVNKGIEEIELNISELNTLAYQLNFEIDRIKASIQNKFAFNTNKVKKIFEEAEIYFPDQLQKDFEQLITFNNALTTERNKLLNKSKTSKEAELAETQTKLIEYNNQKENLLAYLRDTDTFKRFKLYQKDLVKVEGQILKLKEKLQTIDILIDKESEREKLLKEIDETIDKIKASYKSTENNIKYSDIRSKFSNYYKKVLDEDARISWSINKNNNVEFIPPKIQTKGELKRDTAKDEGKTYKKILCVCFDLAILTSYNSESYFKFVYHDDVLSQQDNGIKTRLLAVINDILKLYDLQYIFSVIKSDLPHDSNDKPIHFSNKEIVLRLHDKDETGTLFGFEF